MGCKFGSTLIDGTSFFNLTRCFRSLPHVVLGLDFQWSVSDLKIFACSEPTLGVLPLSVSSVPELVYALLKKHNSGWREAWGFFLLDDSIDLWVLFNALHGYTSLASFAIWGLPYGSGIFRIGVCHNWHSRKWYTCTNTCFAKVSGTSIQRLLVHWKTGT